MNTSISSPAHHRQRRVRASTGFLVAGALLAWLATPVRADIIDDFSGPKKFSAAGLGGYPIYSLDGEFHCQLKTPWSAGAFWYTPRTYELPEGMPVEFRLDVVRLSHEAAYGALGVAFPAPPTAPRAGGRFYVLYWLQERVILAKGYDVSSYYVLDATHAPVTVPVTLSLTFTRQGDTLIVGARVARRDEPQDVIFALPYRDGPEADGEGDNGAPPSGPVIGVGMYVGNLELSSGHGVLDNLVCSADPTPLALQVRRAGGTSLRLTWPSSGVLLEAETPEGPWRPWPGTCSLISGALCVADQATRPAKFYRAAAGEHCLDAFSQSWDAVPRLLAPASRGQASMPALTVSGGRGHIQGEGARNADFLLYYDIGFAAQRDTVASVDLVDWDDTMEDAAFGIVLRAKPEKEFWFPRADRLPQDRYAGMLTFKKAGSPSESVLSLTGPGGEPLEVKRLPAVDPTQQYRLRFWAVGSQLKLELFRLDDLDRPVETCEATDGRVSEGMDALYGLKSSGNTYDVTIDRYLITTTRH